MASYEARISYLEQERRLNKRQAARAMQRRRAALLRRDWKGARSALKVARENRSAARENLRDIRVIRKNRKAANRATRLLRHRRKAGRAADGRQLYWFDGRKVSDAAYRRLKFARAHGWTGYLTSGYRDPYYSQGLCFAMCGAPFCRGRCAGTGSNHVRDAIDVTKPWEFNVAMLHPKAPRPRWFNALGSRDPVHFSPNGR